MKKNNNIVLFISTVLLIIGFILKQTLIPEVGSFTIGVYHPITALVMIGGTFIAGFGIFRKAIGALRYKIISIDLLVSIAAVGAIAIFELWEAMAVTYLFIFGDFLEKKTLEKTRGSIQAILKLAPTTVVVLKDDIEVTIDPDQVIAGDLVVVKPGDKIAVDGRIVKGSASVNSAAINGESIPQQKTIGEHVISGSVIENGYLVIEAERVGEDTTFSRILTMVEEAQDTKAKTQKFMEKFAKWYTPLIILLSLIIGTIFGFINKDFTQGLHTGLTLLVIACPGALVISVPVSIVAGIGNSAKHNIVIKGGDIMERIGKTQVVAFDKTGTLTGGKPVVVSTNIFSGTEEEFLKVLQIGESFSEHPLAEAIVSFTRKVIGQINEKPEESNIITGQGISFSYNGESYLLGNKKLLDKENINYDNHSRIILELEQKGYTLVFLATKTGLIGIVSLFDEVREDARGLIIKLRKSGIEKTVMLTGDNENSAHNIAESIGLSDYYASLMPEDKVSIINKLQQTDGSVLMIGDGVNDAPALAYADVSVAMGLNGTNVAIETADVILLSDDLDKLDHAVNISKKTVNNMRINIVISLITVIFLLLGVIIEVVDLALGMLVHELSVLVVIFNAMRLLGYKRRGNYGKKK